MGLDEGDLAHGPRRTLVRRSARRPVRSGRPISRVRAKVRCGSLAVRREPPERADVAAQPDPEHARHSTHAETRLPPRREISNGSSAPPAGPTLQTAAPARAGRTSRGTRRSGASEQPAPSAAPGGQCARRRCARRDAARPRLGAAAATNSRLAGRPRGTASACFGSACRSRSSADVDEVDDEDQRLAGCDGAASAAVAVGEVRRDDELASAADLHAGDALVPAGDDLADAESEGQRFAAVVGGVELLAGGVRDADVVGDDGAAGGGLGAIALGDVGDLEVSSAEECRGSRSQACRSCAPLYL